MFGTRLDTLVARDGGEIPFIIRRVAEYIEENGMDSEGLYRVNGNAKNIEKMRLSFDKGTVQKGCTSFLCSCTVLPWCSAHAQCESCE